MAPKPQPHRRVPADAAILESHVAVEARHLPLFIQVIENCSTVANDTQTKYGT